MNPLFVAEVSSNHNQDLQRCFELIDKAAKIGCDAVKFQLFKINELFAPEILKRSAEHRKRRQWELPVEFLPELAAHCQQKDIKFSCTPFYLKAVEELLPYVDFYKIASYELLWSDLLKACAQTGKPVVLSTGMATIPEVESAVITLREARCTELTLLHCISDYPAPAHVCNLAVMAELREIGHCAVGWSDHSGEAGVIYNAIFKWQAEMIEFHIDLDGYGAEFQTGHCWLPEQMQHIIHNVRMGFKANGNGQKILTKKEEQERDWRADPEDGLRPFKHVRRAFGNRKPN